MSSLKELTSVLSRVKTTWERDEDAALVMITDVWGSSYRPPGTKIMISSDGQVYGTLSGGCLEADLIEWTKKAILQKKPLIKSYDLSENDLWGLGIGCKGGLEILILPLEKNSKFWSDINSEILKNELVHLVINLSTGEVSLFNSENQLVHRNGDYPPAKIINELFFQSKQQKYGAKVINDREERYVIDTIYPPEILIVSGAGHDAVLVVDLAIKANFEVIVLDPRLQYNHSKRFPGAQHCIADPIKFKELSITYFNCWWIIMNHHMERDKAALNLALNSSPEYVGVLGPIKRTEELLESIGETINHQSIYAPIGLDLGGDTVEEVGISIISELLAIRNKKTAGQLKGKSKIHQRK